MRSSVRNASVRLCVGLLVAALHLVVLLLALTATWNRREAASESRALTLIDIDESDRPLPAVPQQQNMVEPTMREPRVDDAASSNVPSAHEKAETTDPAPIR